MGKHLDKLLSIAGDALGPKVSRLPEVILEQAGILAAELEGLLTQKNGFYGFESALHVFPCDPGSAEYDLVQWNSKELWRNQYGEYTEGMLFFAEEIFAEQFSIKDGRIYRFHLETGESKEIAPNFEAWAKLLLDIYNLETGFSVAHEWQVRNGPITVGHRLSPTQPFVLGGGYNIDNFWAADTRTILLFNASLASQIRDLPDGTQVQIKIVD